jgi:hypothetical protein
VYFENVAFAVYVSVDEGPGKEDFLAEFIEAFSVLNTGVNLSMFDSFGDIVGVGVKRVSCSITSREASYACRNSTHEEVGPTTILVVNVSIISIRSHDHGFEMEAEAAIIRIGSASEVVDVSFSVIVSAENFTVVTFGSHVKTSIVPKNVGVDGHVPHGITFIIRTEVEVAAPNALGPEGNFFVSFRVFGEVDGNAKSAFPFAFEIYETVKVDSGVFRIDLGNIPFIHFSLAVNVSERTERSENRDNHSDSYDKRYFSHCFFLQKNFT